MLESVIVARDTLLKPDGLLLPRCEPPTAASGLSSHFALRRRMVPTQYTLWRLRRFARLYCAPVDLSQSYVKEHFGVWESVLGFDLTPMVGLAAQRALDGPIITKARAPCAPSHGTRAAPLRRIPSPPASASLAHLRSGASQVGAGDLLAKPATVAEIDCRTLTKEDLEVGFPNDLGFVAEREGVCHGYCFYFEGARARLRARGRMLAGTVVVGGWRRC